MLEGTDTEFTAQLPDEKEYPAPLLERCELLECLSEGEDTRTLLARDRENDRLYVVKCYLAPGAFYERTEPDALRKLSEDPFPRFAGEYRNDHMRCVLREYVEGETLKELAEHTRFSEEDVIRTGMQLCDELSILHSLTPPVIHRDIKPQNVIIRPDGRPVLIDFGISRVVTDHEMDTVPFGTQGFAPPEQYGFAQTDARSDLYSLGILLTWMLTGKAAPPEPADTPLKKTLARCTAFDPRERFANAAQFKKALGQKHSYGSVRKGKGVLAGLLAAGVLCAAVICAMLLPKIIRKKVTFSDPLLESAVRLNLGLEEGEKLTEDMLPLVTAVYIVADKAYPDPDSFYPAINQWYADGKPVRGTLTTLEELEPMTGLKEVCIVAQELDDISALAGMKEISKVEFKHNQITDISVLAGMTRLTSVGLNDNPVTDISPLTDCPGLAFLDLCDVRTYDPQVVGQLGNFDYLDLSNPTQSYKYLGAKSVKALHLAWTGLSDLHVLDEVDRLEELDIAHSSVTDLSPLALHRGLKILNLSSIPVSDLSVLLELPQLQSITISEDLRPLVQALGEVSFSVYIG